jgi:chromosome segregation ATPase
MIDFTINDFRILTWDSGGCRPAEETEIAMWEEIARLQEQLEAVTGELELANFGLIENAKKVMAQADRAEAAEARAARLEAEREQNAERWLADKSSLETCRDVLRKAKAFHDRDEGLNGFTADYEILRAEIDDALDVKEAG